VVRVAGAAAGACGSGWVAVAVCRLRDFDLVMCKNWRLRVEIDTFAAVLVTWRHFFFDFF
jgi:hypothetical protein